MARLPRYFIKGVPLHIILRGNNRDPIFGNDEDCQFFKEVLQDAQKAGSGLAKTHITPLFSPRNSAL